MARNRRFTGPRSNLTGSLPIVCPRTSPSECAGSVESNITSRDGRSPARARAAAAAHVVLPTPPLPPNRTSRVSRPARRTMPPLTRQIGAPSDAAWRANRCRSNRVCRRDLRTNRGKDSGAAGFPGSCGHLECQGSGQCTLQARDRSSFDDATAIAPATASGRRRSDAVDDHLMYVDACLRRAPRGIQRFRNRQGFGERHPGKPAHLWIAKKSRQRIGVALELLDERVRIDPGRSFPSGLPP